MRDDHLYRLKGKNNCLIEGKLLVLEVLLISDTHYMLLLCIILYCFHKCRMITEQLCDVS